MLFCDYLKWRIRHFCPSLTTLLIESNLIEQKADSGNCLTKKFDNANEHDNAESVRSRNSKKSLYFFPALFIIAGRQ